MAWIEIHQTLPKHKKVIATAGRLSVDRFKLVGHLLTLWCWSLDNVPSDGFIGDVPKEMIAVAAEWDESQTDFFDALVDAGFIDEKSDGYWLHDWEEYAGKLLTKREKEKERSKIRRSTKKRPTVDHRSLRGQTDEQPQKVARHSNSNSTVPITTSSTSAHEESDESEQKEMSLQDYCREVELKMVAEGATPNHIVKEASFEWVKTFHASHVPIDFVKRGITNVFEREERKGRKSQVKTFSYCATVIQDLWAREIASTEPTQAMSFEISATKERSVNSGHNRASPEPSEYDESVRDAFYGRRNT